MVTVYSSTFESLDTLATTGGQRGMVLVYDVVGSAVCTHLANVLRRSWVTLTTCDTDGNVHPELRVNSLAGQWMHECGLVIAKIVSVALPLLQPDISVETLQQVAVTKAFQTKREMMDLYEICQLLPAGRDTTRDEILRVLRFLQPAISGMDILKHFSL